MKAENYKERFRRLENRRRKFRKKQGKKSKQWTDHLEDEKTKQMLIPCNECEFDAENMSNINAHMEKTHGKKLLPQSDSDGIIKNLNYGQCELGESSSDMLKECKDSRQRYCKCNECKYCEANFTTSGELAGHFGHKHTHENPHKCPECDYMSVELSKLKKHMRCHSGEKPYQCECDICHSEFTQSNSLKEHKTIHTGDEPAYQCKLCPVTFGRKADLRLHMQKPHTSKRPMQCEMCGKRLPDRNALKVHEKKHTGERCSKCDSCPYRSIFPF